ncbi:MAG: C-GCAxxG-C-C family protein [Phaeodactylibacter sp.]|nr:C-GCAxxG-C-C family protein [Phaeodactylibacter sp.]
MQPQSTKKLFKKLGTCSRTFFYLLNREFGHLSENEERAADPLAGGIMQKGHQCGMLWGAALAVGAEAHRRANGSGQATALAIGATRHIMRSFRERTNTASCRAITGTDFSKKFQMWRYMLFRTHRCFNLAEKWAPEAVQAAVEGLGQEQESLPQEALSCASETTRKMGATGEEASMVAGFAGGLGLSGHGCGALAAAIWMKSLAWARENPGQMAFTNPEAKAVLEAFTEAMGPEMECHKICGRRFETVEEHTAFVRDGGCEEVMEVLTGV